MRKFFGMTSLLLAALLGACGQQQATAPLETAGAEDVTLITDSPHLADALERVGFDARSVEPDALGKGFETYRGGLVSYTPPPDDALTIDPARLKELLRWSWCDPTFCDPPEPIIGWSFTGVYMTPKLAATLLSHDLRPRELATFSGAKLAEVLARFDVRITYRICDGLTGECFDVEVPAEPEPMPCPICENVGRYFELEAHQARSLEEADLVIVDSPALLEVEAELGELIQLRGAGLEPVIKGVGLAVHAEAGEARAVALAEALVGTEAQLSLYEHADLLPVVPELLDELAQGSFGDHVRGALEFGGRPLPHPF